MIRVAEKRMEDLLWGLTKQPAFSVKADAKLLFCVVVEQAMVYFKCTLFRKNGSIVLIKPSP